MILIMPCCGRSERYGDLMKQFIHHPDGKPLPVFSSDGVIGVSKKYYVFLEEDFWKHYNESEFDGDVVLLKKQTESQVETILEALDKIPYPGNFYIKDCDNYFFDMATANCISVIRADASKFRLDNKSFSLATPLKNNRGSGRIIMLSERERISEMFNVGGYGFKSPEHFYYYARHQKNVTGVVSAAIADGHPYYQSVAAEYIDYGEYADWKKYLNNYYAPTNR